MTRVNGVVDVDAGEDGEDVSLQECDQKLECGQRHGHAEWQNRAERQKPTLPNITTKPPNTLRVMWPASMLANKRTLWRPAVRRASTSMNVTNGLDVIGIA